MSIFSLFMRKAPAAEPEAVQFPASLGAVASGRVVPMEELPDAVFSTGVLGLCCGIEPTEGKIYAPIGGRITQLADTLHAIGIQAGPMELLIHVGMDTVEMNGDGFVGKVREGATVSRGDLLVTVDLDKVRRAGHPTVAVLMITNADDFSAVRFPARGEVSVGDPIITVEQ